MNCPKCNKKIVARAVVSSFLEDPEWDFWGRKGESRGIVCVVNPEGNSPGFVHFRVLDSHRLAIIKEPLALGDKS